MPMNTGFNECAEILVKLILVRNHCKNFLNDFCDLRFGVVLTMPIK